MGADLDVCDLHLSIRNGITRQPYITSDGQVSLNVAYESIEWSDVMYEANVTEVSTARIVLPSLLAFPELRPLLQPIKEGDRVELFANQPDCGDPVFSGFIPPNGITEADGKTTLDVQDTLGQLRWQHLRRMEYLSAPASGLYDRARSIWVDLVNADFADPSVQSDFTLSGAAGGAVVTTWGAGFVRFAASSTAGFIILSPASLLNKITFQPGDTYLLECDATLTNLFTSSATLIAHRLASDITTSPTQDLGATLQYQPTFIGAFPASQTCDVLFNNGPVTHQGLAGTNQVSLPTIQSHHFAAYIRFNTDGTASVFVYLDNIQQAFFTGSWPVSSTTFTPTLVIQSSSPTESVTLTSWRVSKLVPALVRAARFNPQTIDALTYQPNNEDNLQFLQLVAQKDNAEYRPLYHSWATWDRDELEVDQVGTLGKFASRLLGYEQPSNLPLGGSPEASPFPAITDAANFLTTPPFRFEEGYNLESAPKILARANAHANDVIRVGASSVDSQVFAEKWSAAELGRPQHSPSGALYPRFEQITNDDRVGIQSLVATMAQGELTRRIDSTPSLEVAVVEEIPWAFRWRAGDQVFVRTQSLRTNIEQELRAVKVQYKAGSPLRTVVLGKTDFDPTLLRQLSESMKISWLYEQSGSNPGIYVYPSVGNILAGATSAVFKIPLDQYTTGSALVYAAIHWFADANVLNVNPVINGTQLDLSGVVAASGTDSGLVVCTSYFQSPGSYQLQFTNNDAATRNLTGAFLVLRIKG